MEISGELAETLRKLSKVNIDFIEFVKNNPESLKSSSFKILESTRYSYKLQSWPTFINPQTKASFLEMGVKVFDLIKSIPARLFDKDPKRIAAYFEQPASVVNLQLEGITDDNLTNMVGRMDCTFSTSGLKCLEFNISVGTSGWQLAEWESLYLNTSIIDRFLAEYHVKIHNDSYMGLFLDHIIHYASPLASTDSDGGTPKLNVVLVSRDYTEDGINRDPFMEDLGQLYKEKLSGKTLRGNIYMCEFPQLECIDNMVYFKGKRIHGLIELLHGFLPPGIMKAYTSGNIRLLNGPMTGLLSNKLNLALLSENEDSSVFSSEEKETIKKYIPWTRKIIPGETVYRGEKIRMENFLIPNKDKLVIKPPLGLGGERVYIGQDTFRREWEYLVTTAFRKKNFIAQELVEAPRLLYQVGENGCAYHDTVWGIWILGSQYGAAFVRALPAGIARRVVNGAQGAEISIVFEVDD
jgi:hypothetical protein